MLLSRTSVIWKSGWWWITSRSGWLLELLTELTKLCFCYLRKHNFWLLKLLETSFQGPFDNGHFDRKFSTSLTNCVSLAVEIGCFDGSLRFKSRLKRIKKYLLASCRPEARYSTTTLQLSWLTWGSITLVTRSKQGAFRQIRKRPHCAATSGPPVECLSISAPAKQ